MIGLKIKTLRQEANMSISELAEKAGVAKSYLSSIERNIQSNPSIQFIEKIAEVLNVSVNDLIQESTNGIDEKDLDAEWLEIVQEAMKSGISKEQFIEYLEFNKWRNNNQSD